MKVLFVCTENVARSRAAETLFHELQGGSGRHEVRSVGTASHAARRITTRELEILQLIVDGKSNKEIADQLKLSVNTVAVHRANIMDALGLHKTAELVVYAIREVRAAFTDAG